MEAINKVKYLIAQTKQMNMDIELLTVDAGTYDELLRTIAIEPLIDGYGDRQITIYGVRINKRKCKGCCTHD